MTTARKQRTTTSPDILRLIQKKTIMERVIEKWKLY